jgi:hypothetical protein
MAAPSINGTKKAKAKAAAGGGAKMHKARTGSRLISGGDWLRIGYRAGVKRQSSAVDPAPPPAPAPSHQQHGLA